MNACMSTDFSVFGAPQSPSYVRPNLRAIPSAPTPAQQQVRDRVHSFLRRAPIASADECVLTAPDVLDNLPRLLMMLPADLPVTDSYFSHTGSLCFDWDDDSENQLSIMLVKGNKVAFAAYFSGDRVHGTSQFKAGGLPDELAAAIRKWQRRTKTE